MRYAFPGRIRPLLAAAASGLALLAIAAYVSVPTLADPTVSMAYEATASATPTLSGFVKKPSGTPVRKAGVRLTFRAGNRRVLQNRVVRPPRDGRFRVGIPRGTRILQLRIRSVRGGGRVVRDGFRVRPGRSMSVTAVFPPRGSGIFPGLFPY